MSTALGLELAGLLARVEAAEGADRDLDEAIALTLCDEHRFMQLADAPVGLGCEMYRFGPHGFHSALRVTGSLDATLGLCERVLPGWERHVRIMSNTDALGGVVEPGAWERKGADFRGLFTANHKSPALALLGAMLRALIASTASPEGDAS